PADGRGAVVGQPVLGGVLVEHRELVVGDPLDRHAPSIAGRGAAGRGGGRLRRCPPLRWPPRWPSPTAPSPPPPTPPPAPTARPGPPPTAARPSRSRAQTRW